jgi:predicted MPP superfamily phosphohydrolase
MMSRRRLVLAGAGAALLGLTAGRFAHGMTRGLRVARHEIDLEGWPAMRIVHLTDLHLGLGTRPSIVDEAVAEVRAARPDLVALTGDYVNVSLTHLHRLSRLVAALPRPCFATLGNHDHWSGVEGIAAALEEAGATVLRNESVELEVRGVALSVVGVDDGLTRHDDVPAAFCGVPEPSRALVLTHYPATAERVAELGAALVLAGHTHGVFSKAPRVEKLSRRIEQGRYFHGLYRVGRTTLHVSAGIGSTVPGSRGGLGADPEVAILEVRPRGTPYAA